MRIALIGFGGMGQAVYQAALKRGHTVDLVVDHSHEKANLPELTASVIADVDVAIDFSHGDDILKHLDICAADNVDYVIGSTGWYDKMDEIKKMAEESEVGVIWSSNFSIGVNLYYRIVEEAAKMINNFDEYDIWGHEIHHKNKKDSPSGTAKILQEILLKNISRKSKIVEDKLDRQRDEEEIHFSSVRGGAVNFEHTIGFDSEADTITISHSARSRNGYADGAVRVAEWIKGKKGFFGMDDFLNSV